MPEYDKFREVAGDYQQRFGFDPYYSTLIGIMAERLHGTVLEIGAANGILPEKLNQVWRDKPLIYYSVEPVEEAVAVAHDRTIDNFAYIPKVGTLENAIKSCNLEDKEFNALIASRSLHEIFLGYGRDIERLYGDLGNILTKKSPELVIYGVLEKYEGLTEEETQKVIRAQIKRIRHGHNPAKDYLDFSDLVRFMQESCYSLVEEHHLAQPLEGFNPSPWRFGIGVFRR